MHRQYVSVRGLGTPEQDLQLCQTERTNQAQMYAQCKDRAVGALAVVALVAGAAGYALGKIWSH